jgi:hypothetical protein
MMGRSPDNQEKLFYTFDLDTVVPTDHLHRPLSESLGRGDWISGVCPPEN